MIILKILAVYAVVVYIVWFVCGMLDADDDTCVCMALLWPLSLPFMAIVFLLWWLGCWFEGHPKVLKRTVCAIDVVTLPLRPGSLGHRASSWLKKLRKPKKKEG